MSEINLGIQELNQIIFMGIDLLFGSQMNHIILYLNIWVGF